MEHNLHFASSSHSLNRRTHARLLAGLLLGLTTAGWALPETAAKSSPRSDAALWESAVAIARASRWVLPGRAVIEETSRQDRTTARSRITAQLRRDGGGEPEVEVTEVRLGEQDLTRERADGLANTLLPLVEAFFQAEHPLARATEARPQAVGELVIDGVRCRGFLTHTESDGVKISMTTWIDPGAGFARRIRFQATNLPLRRDGTLLRELDGTADYALDRSGRWVLLRKNEHSELQAQVAATSVALRADRTITCDDHWEYRGVRRAAPPAHLAVAGP